MAKQSGSYDLRAAKAAYDVADAIDQHFWTDANGAHVTDADQDTYLADPANAGGNTLIDSSGMSIRDGQTVLASFGSSGAQIGQSASGHTTISTGGMTIFGGSGTNIIANLGYGPGVDQSGGTSDAPSFSLGRRGTGAIGNYSTALGNLNAAAGFGSVAMGTNNKAAGPASVAEGILCEANGSYSHVEGYISRANGNYSHAEGYASNAVGLYAHAEGASTVAQGSNSHTQNSGTRANGDDQTALGRFNVVDNSNEMAVIIGNGTDSSTRSNALTVDWDGNVEAAGDIEDGSGNILSGKQDTLVSGTTIKTVNGVSLLGAGDVGASDLVDLVYPVGAIYMSVNSTSPATLFGGTWQQIQDTFLLAAGSNYTAGATGGNATHTHTTGDHTLTAAESGMPSHTHGDTFSIENHASKTISGGAHGHTANYRSVYNGSSNYSAVSGTGGTGTTTGAIVNTSGTHSHTISAYSHTLTGSVSSATATAATSAHNHGDTGSSSNMPPYLAVYVWQRTA